MWNDIRTRVQFSSSPPRISVFILEIKALFLFFNVKLLPTNKAKTLNIAIYAYKEYSKNIAFFSIYYII